MLELLLFDIYENVKNPLGELLEAHPLKVNLGFLFIGRFHWGILAPLISVCISGNTVFYSDVSFGQYHPYGS